MDANTEQQVITYFQPGQIVFHLSGKWDGAIEPELKSLVEAHIPKCVTKLERKLSTRGIIEKQAAIGRIPKKALILERVGDPLTLKFAKKLSVIGPLALKFPEKSVTLISYNINVGEMLGIKYVDPSLLLSLIKLLDTFRGVINKGVKPFGVELQAVSPNWLMSGSSEPGSTGGPGGTPCQFQDTIDDPNMQHLFHIGNNLLTALPQNIGQWGENVVVAVLDTVPPPGIEVDDIYRQWVTDAKAKTGKEHPLIKSLCDSTVLPSGNKHLNIHRKSALEDSSPQVIMLDTVTNTYKAPGWIQPVGHENYKMTDHGLFVAGIIHSLARNAEIHLYQVLNPYGVGDMTSVTNALNEFYENFASSCKQLVVNMSLTFNMPLEEGHIVLKDGRLDEVGKQILSYKPRPFVTWLCKILNYIFGWPILPWFDRQVQPLEDICDKLNRQGAHVIAAAGNDRKTGQPHARYPAALDIVLGVGALPKFNPTLVSAPLSGASYSNLSDRPKEIGITTFGGEEGEAQGVLGIYVGDFPSIGKSGSKASENGWAWWCGTSFATPIISGITAIALTGQPPSPSNDGISSRAKEVINQLLDDPQTVAIGPNLITNQNEGVLGIRQGPPPP